MTITRTILVYAPADFCLRISNDVERWPEIMPDYQTVKILRHEGMKFWFRINHTNGTEWTSWRIVSPAGGFAYAERYEPMEPFRYMQLIWLYKEAAAGTNMTWTMCCELGETAAAAGLSAETFGKHTEENQERMKRYIEARFATEVRN